MIYLENSRKDHFPGMVRFYDDYPIKGIRFVDITPLFMSKLSMEIVVNSVADFFRDKVTMVAGIEARGFILGTAIASQLGVGFVPMRKKGKLPGEVYTASFKKEYGEDILEMKKDALVEGTHVLVVDDVLATGGTFKAAAKIMEWAKVVPYYYCFINLNLIPENYFLNGELYMDYLIDMRGKE